MPLIYHNDDLEVTGVITYFPHDYDRRSNGENFVEVDDHIPHHETVLDRCPETGCVRVWHAPPDGEARRIDVKPTLAEFEIVAPDRLDLGVEAVFTNVPPGTRIIIPGATIDTMDESREYAVTVTVPAHYTFRFEREGYKPWQVYLEAHPRS